MSTEINKEALKTDSNISSMRVQFNKVVNAAIIIAIITTLGELILPFFGKSIDISGLVALDSLFLGIAFGGKATQSFSENPSIVAPTTAIDSQTQVDTSTTATIEEKKEE